MPGVSWHDQEVELTLRVPLNSTLIIDEDLDRYLRYGIGVRDCKESNKKPNSESATFIMTVNGLECKIDTLTVTPAIKPDTAKAVKIK